MITKLLASYMDQTIRSNMAIYNKQKKSPFENGCKMVAIFSGLHYIGRQHPLINIDNNTHTIFVLFQPETKSQEQLPPRVW